MIDRHDERAREHFEDNGYFWFVGLEDHEKDALCSVVGRREREAEQRGRDQSADYLLKLAMAHKLAKSPAMAQSYEAAAQDIRALKSAPPEPQPGQRADDVYGPAKSDPPPECDKLMAAPPERPHGPIWPDTCTHCGHVPRGDLMHERCPECGKLMDGTPEEPSDGRTRWICPTCGNSAGPDRCEHCAPEEPSDADV
jgi:predicted RNA-binding Zn-ribbon protein involved in translation (DUF1610 family)